MTITPRAENPPARLLKPPAVLFGGRQPADVSFYRVFFFFFFFLQFGRFV